MIPLITAVFVASLTGSTHCAGMCGAFLAFAVAGESAMPRSRALLHAAYNLGRLCTYTLLGAGAGLLGRALDLGGAAVGVQRAAMIAAGTLMILFGAVAVLRAAGVHIGRVPLPPGLARFVGAGHRTVAAWPPPARALSIGLLTTLLPCGWLYAFAVTAAGTADWKLGALTMAVFWLGTLPVMVALGAGLQFLAGPLRRRVPVLTALAMLGVGAWTVVGRLHTPAFARQPSTLVQTSSPTIPTPGKAPCCNDE